MYVQHYTARESSCRVFDPRDWVAEGQGRACRRIWQRLRLLATDHAFQGSGAGLSELDVNVQIMGKSMLVESLWGPIEWKTRTEYLNIYMLVHCSFSSVEDNHLPVV